MNKFKRPNILFIYTDQMRFDALSCNNSSSPIETKNIDSIAHNGINFKQCYTQSPICGPSRASFLSGLYPSANGIGTNGISYNEKFDPIWKTMKPYGYETAQIGKLHFQSHARRDHRNMPNTYGFDRAIISDEPGCYDDCYTKWVECIDDKQLPLIRTQLPPAAGHWGNKPNYSDVPRNTHEPYIFEGEDSFTHSKFVSSESVRFLKERDKNKPFFAIAGFYAPHPPINPPKSCLNRVDLSKIIPPHVGDEDDIMDELKDLSDDDWIKIKSYYLALTLHVDDCVGEILGELKDQGIEENTLIVFTSDHGEYLGDHSRIQKGMPGYDCITHVPLLMSYPHKIPRGIEREGLVEAIDVSSTILDYSAIQAPLDMMGKSLRSLINNKSVHHRDSVLTQHFTPYGIRETRIRTEKFSYYASNKNKELLFDLEIDPHELKNVASNQRYSSTLSSMRYKMLIRIMDSSYANTEMEAEY
ncbi:MAG: sulfatase-like hydrolase/transferase [Sphaerochaetaceae bacterium]